MIFSKVIIDRKKKLAVRKVDEKVFATVLALIAITGTLSSDMYHNEPKFYIYCLVYLWYSSKVASHPSTRCVLAIDLSYIRVFKLGSRNLLHN